jgi:hypothetical protein
MIFKTMSAIKDTILEEQEFSRKEIEAMPEPETIDPNEEVEREKDDDRDPEAFIQSQNNFENSL